MRRCKKCLLKTYKNERTEMNNTLKGISRVTEAEEQINDLEDKMVEITATEQNIEKRMRRNEDSLRDLWDNNKHNDILIKGVPEEERKDLRKYLKRQKLKTSPTWKRKKLAKSRKHRDSQAG